MKLNESKSGISLIVLVITIIVMIILAATIILSLNSSNISGKANEAKMSSDMSNKKEAASVYLSEYYIKVAKGKINADTTSANDYVRAELKKSGLDVNDVAVTEDGDILVGIAAAFINNNVPIGTEVKEYKLNSSTSYTTSGNENTAQWDDDNGTYSECNPQSKEIKRDDNIKWKYMGIDENGKLLIVGSITSNSTEMILGGKGGYLNGPQELNNACEAMYSSSMGKARSINIADVTRVLKYTGEIGAYYDLDDEYKQIFKEKTINEIAKEIGYNMINFQNQTPEDGKKIGEYKVNFYYIDKEDDAGEYNSSSINEKIINLIYPGNDNTLTKEYWLASSSVDAGFSGGYASFSMRYVYSSSITADSMFLSFGGTVARSYSIRPVVSLNPSVQMTYSNGVVTLK